VTGPRPEPGVGPGRLVGMAEIAELAGSSRQAITNLRARDQGFPAPLAELRSGPVFREADIRAYLDARGRATQPAEIPDGRHGSTGKFDPLTPLSLAQSVERVLLDQPLSPLPPATPFGGGGVYCVYYSGPYEPYAPIAGEPPRVPVYAGRSAPRAGRPGSLLAPADQPLLFNRLRDHARTLQQADQLRLDDFSCRFLVVDDVWAPLAEELLIAHFRPLWNVIVDGFGLREPGRARSSSPRPAWDELHPGRPWAARLRPPARSRAEILQAVAAHLSAYPPPDLSTVPRSDGEASPRDSQ
jgi:hypothetical protein